MQYSLSSESLAYLDMEWLLKAKPIVPDPRKTVKVRQNMYDYYTCERCGNQEPGRSFLVVGKEHNYYSKLCKDCRNADRKAAYVQNPHRIRVYQAKGRCKAKGLDFDIDEGFLEQLIAKQNNKCYYSGIDMDPAGVRTPYVASLDRVDSKKGYTRDNVVYCCDIINTMKSNLPLSEFYSIIEKIIAHKNKVEESP